MSFNQPRADRSDSSQYRRGGRSASFSQKNSNYSASSGKGGGAAAPPQSSNLQPNRSFSKKSYNAQGGQSRAGGYAVNLNSDPNSGSASHPAPNGSHLQPPVPGSVVKPTTELPAQRTAQVVTNAPSQAPNVKPDPVPHATPTKAPGDASKSIPIQFGSVSPGTLNVRNVSPGTSNVMQIPARTSSAPPNLVEQQRDQARRELMRQAPPFPIPTPPKQQIQKKVGVAGDQLQSTEAHQVLKPRRDIQGPSPVPVTQYQKAPPVQNIPGVSMTMPYHHQVPVQFGGPTQQMQPQGLVGTSLSMPMPMPLPIPMGNAGPQMPHSVYLHPHQMQAQGIMHHGQGMNYSSQMGSHMPPSQLGSLGMGPRPPFSQLQTPNSVGSRKTVKITHPETHEELKLENATGPRSRQNMLLAQPVTSIPSARPTNYPNSANYSAQGSVSLNSAINPSSQLLRPATVPSGGPASVQVTIKPATAGHGEKLKDLASSASSVEKVLSQKNGEASSNHPQKDLQIRPNSSSNQEKPLASSASIEEPAPVASHVPENRKKETNNRGDSIKDEGKKLISERSSQVPGQSASVPSLTFQSLEHTNLVSSISSQTPTPKPPSLSSGEGIVESARESLPTDSSKISVTKAVDNSATKPIGERTDASTHVEPLNNEGVKDDNNNSKTPSEPASSKVSKVASQTVTIAAVKTNSQKVGSLEVAEKGTEDPLYNCKKDNAEVSSAPLVSDADESLSTVTSLASSDGDRNISTAQTSVDVIESVDSRPAAKSVVSDDVVAPVSIISLLEPTLKSEKGAKEKPAVELSRSKSSVTKGKKKGKEFFRKADAAGTTDLYMAYKVPEEKKEIVDDSDTKEVLVDSIQDDVDSDENVGQGKAEPDDWEDAADNSTPKLEAADKSNKVSDDDGTELMAKKYTRDFLMKFSEQCSNLPNGFEIPSDLADAFMVTNVNVSRESYPSSPGRVVDRSPGGPRRGVVVGDEDRWNRNPGLLVSGRDLRMDGHGGNFRPGQGGNHGVLRNQRGQASLQCNSGGILSGPMQSMSSQIGMQRSNSDADRWQRATGFQKGLIPSPHTPVQIMHKAEKKYQVGKITDEEEAKQRLLKSILNKLTPQNFEKLFEQVKTVNIDNAGTLTGVISQIFDKALMEPTFCEMYANFCYHLAGELPDFSEDDEKITFKRLLLNKCQEEFERGEREQEEADRADAEGEVQQSPAEREEKRIQARRRMLGNIRLIGELYKKRMLTERIMHECIKKLLGQYNNPDEEDIESLCKLMSTIGEMIDHPKAKEHMDAYFDMMSRLSNNMKLSSRVRFMLKDAIDLRKNKWQQRRKVEGPKKIEDVHRDAAQERHVQAGRLGRGPGPGPNSSIRNRQPMDFSARGSSMLTSPNSQMGGYRGLQSQPRGFGVQDARIDDRHSFESRTPSVPLHHRPLGEESIMLGPQGGLARGMSSRGQPLIANTPLAEAPSSRTGPGLNGFGSVQDRSSAYGTREDLMPRHSMAERFSGPYDQGAILDRNTSFGNRTGNRSRPSSPNVGLTPTQNVGSEKVWPEERLREMSLSTIKEFYSAKDEKEVALCVKDLNAPSFYPTMISLWISDSFERKDMERDSLAKLLTNLSKSRDSLLNHDHLIKGFESVLSTLEDAVNDAPKAGEFLGRIFAKIIVEDVIPFPEIGQLIYDGGEEKGSLVEFGLAAEVVGTILEIVKSEKGESFLNNIRTNPGSKLERFRPPNSKKTLRLDKFI